MVSIKCDMAHVNEVYLRIVLIDPTLKLHLPSESFFLHKWCTLAHHTLACDLLLSQPNFVSSNVVQLEKSIMVVYDFI